MRKIFLAATAMVFAGVGSAAAADIMPPPIIEAPIYEAPQPVAAAGGWYLRGDVGYSWNKLKGAEFFQGGLGTYAPFTTTKLRSSYTVGGGVGYQINHQLRTDVTLDYFSKADFKGSTRGGGAVAGVCAGPCTSTDLSSVSGLSLLANAYVDLYKRGRFTLYGGAGIGGTRVKWDTLRNTACADSGAGCAPTDYHGGAAGWRFTYALMAGASIDLTCNLKADVGYRYRNIAGGAMFKSLTSNGYQGYHKDITSHEVRGGLRYGFGGCAQEEVYIEPAPIMPAVYK
ncbi:HEAT resistant agglutinin 1 protein [Hoeflea sp. BAL378]|uniref:outer membrane protein n=1 Tax=Hoeflea sp. BAL378 TaxID=1547437 RepID=UPI000513819E|nr:outer membrane protein [Hoeflea sp. BAL378]KGF66774.1 HEAT resistant agglutinin 1 protein [Hoeflea sp. BAL378]